MTIGGINRHAEKKKISTSMTKKKRSDHIPWGPKTTKLYVLEVNMFPLCKLINQLQKKLDSLYEETEFGPLTELLQDPYDPTIFGGGLFTKDEMIITVCRKTKKGRDNAKAIIQALFLVHGLIPAFFHIKEYEEEIPAGNW